MPDDQENQGGGVVAEAADDTAQPAEQATDGEPGGRVLDQAAVNRGMDAFLRGTLGEPALTLKPSESDASGEPAPEESGDVEAGDAPERGPDGRFISRRGVPEAAKLREEVRAELLREQAGQAEQAKLDELSQSRAADVARYRTLIETPDSQLSGEDYQWREEFKEKLALLPEVGALHQSLAEQRIAEGRERLLADQRSQIEAGAAEFGVDPQTWKTAGTTWLSMTRDAVVARTAPLEAQIAQLQRDLHNARTAGLGAARAPVAAGRSSGGQPAPNMNDWLRGA